MTHLQQIGQIEEQWRAQRFRGVMRTYRAADVVRLRGTLPIEYTLARAGAEKLWTQLTTEAYVHAMGALTGNQAMQMARAGLKAIYVSGWQVAADGNNAGQMYPDLSLYPADSVPCVVRRLNGCLQRADEIHHADGENGIDWFLPIVADAEAGFGGVLNAFEDQLASAKKCGHMGGKVLVPTREAVQKLVAARLAADLLGVPTVLIARTDAETASLLTSDIDPADRDFLTGERTPEGFFRVRAGMDQAIARGLAYAPYADLVWCETSTPDLDAARRFADTIHDRFPGKLLGYNCSPSFAWKKRLDDAAIADFQPELGAMGYKFQFVTLAGFHALNYTMFDLADRYRAEGMTAYVKLQESELAAEPRGYSATKHQHEVGAGYFDDVAQVVAGGASSVVALRGSTEEDQFTTTLRSLRCSHSEAGVQAKP